MEVGGSAPLGEPYGPLCRSHAKLTWVAPPPAAYPRRRPITGAGPRPGGAGTVPVGAAPGWGRDYGLGRYGESTYAAEYTDKSAVRVDDEPPE